jgi:hypothetical protein
LLFLACLSLFLALLITVRVFSFLFSCLFVPFSYSLNITPGGQTMQFLVTRDGTPLNREDGQDWYVCDETGQTSKKTSKETNKSLK